MLRVILVDHIEIRANLLRQSLTECGYEVAAILNSTDQILKHLDRLAPDVIIADMQSPDRDTIEDVRYLMKQRPCPVVMHSGTTDSETINRAIDAGVSAYITDEISVRDVRSILDVACARFHQFEKIRSQLKDTKEALEGRKNVDRAKSLLARHHGLNENDAHRALQQLAMNQRISVNEAARNVIAMLDMLNVISPNADEK